jgi:glycolate oxidase FAD binding subunit
VQDGEIVWRLSVPPSAGPAVVAAIARGLPLRALYDWGGGLIWLALPGDSPDGGASEVRQVLAAVGGHATLFRAPETLRSRVAVFHPQPEGLAALSRRLKLSLDPAAILNRGRLVEGL